ncbi:hypothetical protein AYO22_04903 [Fonsecaea multimorphosa]|nr:hypothetical protein AYO22_04903 [Fonsecaea multimorphosa]
MPFSTSVDWLLDETIPGAFDEWMQNSMPMPDGEGHTIPVQAPSMTDDSSSTTYPQFNNDPIISYASTLSKPGASSLQSVNAEIARPLLNDYDPALLKDYFFPGQCTNGTLPLSFHGDDRDSILRQGEVPVGARPKSVPPRKKLPELDEGSRSRILKLIDETQPTTVDNMVITTSSNLLSAASLQRYSNLFFTKFNVSYPLIHLPTFDPSLTDALLLIAILSIGATYDGKDSHQMAIDIHNVLRPRIIQHPSFNEQPELWLLQTILLVDCLGTSRADHKQHAMSNMFHGLLINLLRRADCQNIRTPPISSSCSGNQLEHQWKQAMHLEQRKRLALLCFCWDTQHAVLFSQASCLSAIELRLSLPCDLETWEAETAETWLNSARKSSTNLLFLPVLRAYLHPDTHARPRQLDTFARYVLLHGLMSISSDLKRRAQTSLGIDNQDGSPQGRIRRAYDKWKADFEMYCLDLKLSNRYDAKAFTPLKTAILALYRAAHIALNVEVLDLQILAGAENILGKPVKPHDYESSRKIIHGWLASPRTRITVSRTAENACRIVRDAISDLEENDLTDLFHYPWCLYLACLSIWVLHSGGGVDARPQVKEPAGQPKDIDHKNEMIALIGGMLSCESMEDWNHTAGAYRTQGLMCFMAKKLGTVRWAAMREGTKVLERLGRHPS